MQIMKSGSCSGFCRRPQPTSFRLEQDLQVCRSTWLGRFGSKAIADTVVVKKVPGKKTDEVAYALEALGLVAADRRARERRLYWTSNATRPNTVILFLGEFKKTEGDRNQNRLVLDFGTAQH
jgi:hypothetical protein